MKIKDVVSIANEQNGLTGEIYFKRSKFNHRTNKQPFWSGDFRYLDRKYYEKEIFFVETDNSTRKVILYI